MKNQIRRRIIPMRAKQISSFSVVIALLLSIGLVALIPAPEALAAKSVFDVTYYEGANDVTGMPPNETGEYGGTITAPAAPVKPGYTFIGWKAEADCVTLTVRVAPWTDTAPQEIIDLGPDAVEAFLALCNNYNARLVKADGFVTESQPNWVAQGTATPSGKNDGTGVVTFRNIPYGEYILYVSYPGAITYYCEASITKDTTEILSNGIRWTAKGIPKPTFGEYSDSEDPNKDGVVWLMLGDLNNDTQCDQRDVTVQNVQGGSFANDWVNGTSIYSPKYDMNNDGVIDNNDLKVFTEVFFGCSIIDYKDCYNMAYVTQIITSWLRFISYGVAKTVPYSTYEAGGIYQPGDTFSLPGDMKLTALWKLNEYTVAYNAGEGATGAPDDSAIYHTGDTVTVKPDIPVRDGYTFTGWMYGEKVYEAGDTITVTDENIVLVAQWNKNTDSPTTYSVTVNASGESSLTNGSGSYAAGTTVTIRAGTRSGYTFIGWRVTSGEVTLANQNSATTTFIMPANDVTVEARWDIDEPPTTESPSPESPPPVVPPPTESPSPPPPVESPPVESPNPPPPVEPPPYVPGGTNFQTPPLPMAPGSELVVDGDGWLELDETGTPLGKWEWDGTEWVFDEYTPPLSNMPKTSIQHPVIFYVITLIMLLGCSKQIITQLKQSTQKSKLRR